jgi:hypothetical protein
MGTYLQNSKLASAAAQLLLGLQMARAEAIGATCGPSSSSPTRAVHGRTSPTRRCDVAQELVVRARVRGGFVAIEAKAGAEGDGGPPPPIQVAGSASRPRVFDGRIAFNGFGGTPTARLYAIDITNPAAGTALQGGGKIRCRRITYRPAARSPRAIRRWRQRRTAVRALTAAHARPARLLPDRGDGRDPIFALGILGLVAMGGTAVSSQSDAQYRTEASSLADAIAGEVALGLDRTSEANKAASLLNFAHQPNPAPTWFPRRARSTAGRRRAVAPGVAALLSRAANLGPGRAAGSAPRPISRSSSTRRATSTAS